jgi:SAM-dependent methyltransferase
LFIAFVELVEMMRQRLMKIASVAVSLVLATFCYGQDFWRSEADRLGHLLDWQAGDVVAEIGAGKGQLTLQASEQVGPTGKIFSTELDDKALAHLSELASTNKNIVVVKAGDTKTNLTPSCCDSIFMRDVYHHFTNPAEMDKSLFNSVKSGGRLAIIDQNPRAGTPVPDGAPANREGHGIPQRLLINELTEAGFLVEKIDNGWPGDEYHDIYCIVFRKPKQ